MHHLKVLQRKDLYWTKFSLLILNFSSFHYQLLLPSPTSPPPVPNFSSPCLHPCLGIFKAKPRPSHAISPLGVAIYQPTFPIPTLSTHTEHISQVLSFPGILPLSFPDHIHDIMNRLVLQVVWRSRSYAVKKMEWGNEVSWKWHIHAIASKHGLCRHWQLMGLPCSPWAHTKTYHIFLMTILLLSVWYPVLSPEVELCSWSVIFWWQSCDQMMMERGADVLERKGMSKRFWWRGSSSYHLWAEGKE